MSYRGVDCYVVVPTGRVLVGLRRYTPRTGTAWTCADSYHQALRIIGETDGVPSEKLGGIWCSPERYDWSWPGHGDPAWPTTCDQCDYHFSDDDEWQQCIDVLWERPDTGQRATLRDFGPGAMWDADWYPWKGPDGRCLVVKCPNGQEWVIDSRASNCTMPDDTAHRCWVRHGQPPHVTVDKNGLTCAAGAGSIQAGDYHGFLRDGKFTDG